MLRLVKPISSYLYFEYRLTSTNRLANKIIILKDPLFVPCSHIFLIWVYLLISLLVVTLQITVVRHWVPCAFQLFPLFQPSHLPFSFSGKNQHNDFYCRNCNNSNNASFQILHWKFRYFFINIIINTLSLYAVFVRKHFLKFSVNY